MEKLPKKEVKKKNEKQTKEATKKKQFVFFREFI